jgi:DNA primase
LDDIAEWLAVSHPSVATTLKPGIVYDDHGPHSAKWDYLSTHGELLACVYRYDTPQGKQYRPWDAKARMMRMPEPRPLYNLPAIRAVDAVVLVEGEKCVDALMQLDIVATTAMGGAATSKSECCSNGFQ